MIFFLLFSFLFAKDRDFLPPNQNKCLFLHAQLIDLYKKTLDIDKYTKVILGLNSEPYNPEVFPFKDKEILQAIKKRLSELQTDFSKPEMREVFNGKKAPAVFIITHQLERLSKDTYELLKDKKYENVPRLFLASSGYPIYSKELLNQATEVRYSLGGETDVKLNTNVVHFAGGYCDLCLANTIKYIADNTYTDEKQIELHLHGSITYGYLKAWELPLTDTGQYTKDLFFNILNGDHKVARYYEFAGQVMNEFYFRRKYDGKIIKIIYDEP